MNRRLILLLAYVLCVSALAGAEALSDSALIHFRQSKVYLDTAYMGNTRGLQHARDMINKYHRPDSNYVLKSVTVVGGASPEGSVRFNEWLSHQRAARIFEYIGSRFELPDSLTHFTFLGRDWGGLKRMVLADPNVPYREEVLELLEEILETYRAGETEQHRLLERMKRLRVGVPYTYMYHRLFPVLRASTLVLKFDRDRQPFQWPAISPIPPLTLDMNVCSSPAMPQIPRTPRRVRPFYMALKTNMLYDALADPNIGAEFFLGKNLSIVGNWMYAWWHSDRRARYWRIYGGDLALRWWFGKAAHEKPLTGHHIGVYGSLLTYDFEWGGTGYMGGIPHGTLWDRCNNFFGIEYGYSLPIARRWNIDFNIGLGHQGGEYQIYDPKDGHYVYRETRHRNYWGPTKAEVSLVWLIGKGNYNRKHHKLPKTLMKGGDQ